VHGRDVGFVGGLATHAAHDAGGLSNGPRGGEQGRCRDGSIAVQLDSGELFDDVGDRLAVAVFVVNLEGAVQAHMGGRVVAAVALDGGEEAFGKCSVVRASALVRVTDCVAQ